MYYTKIDSIFGEILLVADEIGLTRIWFNNGKAKHGFSINKDWMYNDIKFKNTKKQLTEYFNGKRKIFDIPLHLIGTDFQIKAWQKLSEIPYGELRTYKDIAVSINNPKASRAIGSANSRNPIPIIIPCHRVIGSDKKLTGFEFGIELKNKLLELEKNNK